MGYRRLFIMRKDLNMSPGKLASQVAHCAEAYWTNMLRDVGKFECDGHYIISGSFVIKKDCFDQYICGTFTKTICEAKNKTQLMKATHIAQELGLVEGKDYGFIYDKCLTELMSEEDDGTTLTGIWFCPLPDEVAHQISKKYQLYK